MATIARSLSALLTVAMLAACSSAGAGPTPVAPTFANDAHHGGKSSLVLRILVPRKKKTHHAAPRYVSPATAAMKIAILGLAKVTKIVGLTPNAAGCSGISAGTFCTVMISGLKPCPSSGNCYAATISTYDAVTGCPSTCTIPVTAHELSSDQSVGFTIALGRSNQISVTLDGVAASVVLEPDPDASLSGNMTSGFSLGKCSSQAQHVRVYGVDAGNNLILGAGAPIASLVSNDAADLPVTGVPSPSSPNRFTLTPSATVAANKVVQLTIGATPLAGSGALPVTAHINVTFGNGICGVYEADNHGNAVKEILAVGGSIPASPTINELGPEFDFPQGVAVDRSGNVYVTFDSVVQELVAVGGSIPASPTIRTLGSGFIQPEGVAVDGSGNVYVTDVFGAGKVEEMHAVNGSVPATPVIDTLGSGFVDPYGLAVDGSGNVFVADTMNSEVKEIVAVEGSIPLVSPTIITLGSGFNEPIGVAVDSSGNVFVADTFNDKVKEMLAVGGSVPASPTINTLGSGFFRPFGIAIDGSGNVYVADAANNAVKEIAAVGGTVKTLGSGFNNPVGIAVR
jgi:sugar lactone lactonase YvrE